MRALVIHASEFGSTAAIAERIAGRLRANDLEAVVAAAAADPDVAEFDAVVIGSAVHAGRWLPDGTAFVRKHARALVGRPVWLFSSGPLGDRAAASSSQPTPREVKDFQRDLAPRDHVVFGGSFDRETADFSDLGLIERTVVRRFLPEGDWRDWETVDAWADRIAHEIRRAAPVLHGQGGAG